MFQPVSEDYSIFSWHDCDKTKLPIPVVFQKLEI